MTSAATLAALAAATLASEDLTAIGAGLLASFGEVAFAPALAAVAAGIYVGDLALFGIGRLARRLPIVDRQVAKRWSRDELCGLATDLERRLPVMIVASRFLPGSRLPTYVAAGLFATGTARFCLWTFVAVAVWTPALMSAAALLGQTFADAAHVHLRWVPVVGLAAAIVALPRLLARAR